MDLALADRACLVTGATAGIGLATARGLAREGARVAIVARDPERLAQARELLQDDGSPAVVAVEADLGRAGEPERAVSAAAEAFDGLDVLVNNVGIVRAGAWDTLPDADWDASWQINVMSFVRATRAALPHLRRSDQARVVNVSSSGGKRPSQAMPDYTVTKSAVLSFSRLIAELHAGEGILVNAVCPGPTRTPMWLGEGRLMDQTAARAGVSREDTLARIEGARPLGRMAEPEEIADVIVLLCSARASFVTGAAWSVDGGAVSIII